MKHHIVLTIITFAVLLASCSKKANAKKTSDEYVFSGTNPTFTASVVTEKDAGGTEKSYFSLNNYRRICKSREDAVECFNNFKNSYESLKNDDNEMDRSGLVVMQALESMELHVVDKKGDILYADFDSVPNYAEPDDDWPGPAPDWVNAPVPIEPVE